MQIPTLEQVRKDVLDVRKMLTKIFGYIRSSDRPSDKSFGSSVENSISSIDDWLNEVENIRREEQSKFDNDDWE